MCILAITEEENEKYQFCPILHRLQDDHHFMGECILANTVIHKNVVYYNLYIAICSVIYTLTI